MVQIEFRFPPALPTHLSPSLASANFIVCQRLKKQAHILLKQYYTISLSILKLNPRYIGKIVSIISSLISGTLSPFRLADARSSLLNFDRSLFSVAIEVNFFSISRRHADMAFIAAFFSNINFYDCLFLILSNFTILRSHSATTLSLEARTPLLSVTLAERESNPNVNSSRHSTSSNTSLRFNTRGLVVYAFVFSSKESRFMSLCSPATARPTKTASSTTSPFSVTLFS